jgi:hypothetical protein
VHNPIVGVTFVRFGRPGNQPIRPDAGNGSRPNPYEDPRCQEIDSPWERIFGGFSASELLAPSSSGHVFCLGCSRLARPSCGGTTHVWRVDRQRHGECRAPGPGLLRPRNLSVPSSRPTHKRGCPSLCASEVQVRVRGSTPSPGVTLALCLGAAAGIQSPAQGQGTAPMCS